MPGRKETPRADQDASPQQIVSNLFVHPPVNHADLVARLGASSPASVRECLIEKMRFGTVSPAEVSLLEDMFCTVGVGSAKNHLRNIVADRALHARTRACAMSLLLAEDSSALSKLHMELSEDELLSLAVQPLADLLLRIEADPWEAELLADMLATVPDEMACSVFARLEHCRKQSGMRATAVYFGLLQSDPLPTLWPQIVQALQDQGDEEAIMLLEKASKEPHDRSVQRLLQGALLRLRTRLLEGKRPAPGKAHGYLSSCDANGCYVMVARRDNPDGTSTIGVLCSHVQGELRGGYVTYGQPASRCDEICAAAARESHTRFVPVPVGKLFPNIAFATETTLAADRRVSPELMGALRFFSQFPQEDFAPETPKGRLSLKALRALFSKEEFGQGWRFTRSEMEQLSRVLFQTPSGSADTLTDHPLSSKGAMAKRLSAMLGHMVHYYALSDDSESSQLCALAAREVERDFMRSKTMRVVAENTNLFLSSVVKPSASSADIDPPFLTSRADRLTQRQLLKARFFSGLKRPNAYDLIALDFADEAMHSVVETLVSHAAEEWPQLIDLQDGALELACMFREQILSDKQRPPQKEAKLITHGTRLLARTFGISSSLARILATAAFSRMAHFARTVCTQCSVNCWARPHRNASREFFTLEHPAQHVE
jgi:hypothetical protein